MRKAGDIRPAAVRIASCVPAIWQPTLAAVQLSDCYFNTLASP